MSEAAGSRRVVESLPLALALILPMGAFAIVPWIHLPLAGPALGLAVVASVHLGRLQRQARPAFEYWWPAVIAVLVGVLACFRGEMASGLLTLQSVAAFLVPLSLAARGTVARRAIVIFGATCGGLAILQWAAHLGWVPPSLVYVPGNLLFAGPTSLTSGLLLLACGVAANVSALVHPAFSRRARQTAGLALMAALAGSMAVLPRLEPYFAAWTPVRYTALPWEAGIPALLALWLTARIVARAVLMACRARAPRRAINPVLVAILVTISLVVGIAPGPPSLFLLGLMAALDTPWTTHRPAGVCHPVWVFPAACVVLQIAGVGSLPAQDPRNQLARAERLMAAEAWTTFDGLVSTLRDRRPAWPALTLLQARAWLERGWPVAAVDAYSVSKRQIRPDDPFQARHQQAFLDALRDASSAQERGRADFFFERALIHQGDLEHAQDVLAIRRAVSAPVIATPAERETLTAALDFLLGAAPGTLSWASWSAEELAALLADSGVPVRLLPAEAGSPPMDTPHLYRAGVTPAGLFFQGGAVPAIQGQETRHFAADAGGEARSLSLRWGAWHATGEDTWCVDLFDGDRRVITCCAAGTSSVEASGPVPAGALESTAGVLWVPLEPQP